MKLTKLVGRIFDAAKRSPVERFGEHLGDVATEEIIEGAQRTVSATTLQLQTLFPEATGFFSGEKTWLELTIPFMEKPLRIGFQLKQDGEE